jgi:trk system potassium uptake protein
LKLEVRGADPRAATFRIVLRDVAALQVLIGTVMVLPLILSLAYGEYHTAAAFAIAGAVTAGAGGVVRRLFRDAGEPERYHAMIIAGAGWLVTAIFGALPFLLAAYLTPPAVAQRFIPAGESYPSSLFYFRDPIHALFESMSGFTTTGLTMAVNEPSMGRGLLFYRSLAQWVGGVGVIVLSLAIIPRPRAMGGLQLYQSETSGMKLRPSILGTARAIWKIYLALTVFLFLFLIGAAALFVPARGVESILFESVNHAMTGVSTGGFSPLDDSIAGYDSWPMELAHLLPMLLGVIAIPLHYAFFRQRDLRAFWRDPQVRLMLLIIGVVTPLLVVALSGSLVVPQPVRDAVFQVVSGVSGTGWQTSDIGSWRSSAMLLLAGGTMIIGGAAGSTAGGFKLIRAYVLLRAIGWRLRKVFLPAEAVVPFAVGQKRLPSTAMHREISDAAVITFLYLAVLGMSIVFVAHFSETEFTLADAIFESVSAQGTVGLSTGITHPTMPRVVEVIFIIQMWVGRLEIFPVLVLTHAMLRRMARR